MDQVHRWSLISDIFAVSLAKISWMVSSLYFINQNSVRQASKANPAPVSLSGHDFFGQVDHLILMMNHKKFFDFNIFVGAGQ